MIQTKSSFIWNQRIQVTDLELELSCNYITTLFSNKYIIKSVKTPA